jgi:hypothetical protein
MTADLQAVIHTGNLSWIKGEALTTIITTFRHAVRNIKRANHGRPSYETVVYVFV